MDKDKVQDILFNAFEKHQYYAFKDLVGLTQQPSVSRINNKLIIMDLYNKKLKKTYLLYGVSWPSG